jgi:hypothetical protein
VCHQKLHVPSETAENMCSNVRVQKWIYSITSSARPNTPDARDHWQFSRLCASMVRRKRPKSSTSVGGLGSIGTMTAPPAGTAVHTLGKMLRGRGGAIDRGPQRGAGPDGSPIFRKRNTWPAKDLSWFLRIAASPHPRYWPAGRSGHSHRDAADVEHVPSALHH